MSDITPKEAIANLNHLYGMVAPDIQRSLDVAIKALERPTGDCISRKYVESIVKAEFVDLQDGTEEWRTYVNDTCENILNKVENAPTVEMPNQIIWEQGYECGYHQAKEDIAKRIKEQYNEHHELIPYWLSIGDMKGGAE